MMKKNTLREARRSTILIGVMILFIVFLGGFINAATWDDSIDYNSQTQEYKLTNSFGLGSEIGIIKLNTPLLYSVGQGYQKVAEFTITNGNNEWSEILKGIELYQINVNKGVTTYTEFNRQIDYKYKTIAEENVYVTKCSDIQLGNGTSIKGDCKQVLSGTKKVEKWVDFSNIIKGKEKITIGLFTNVEKGDYVEWIPNIYGHNLDEWATWTTSLNTGVIAYYKMDEVTGIFINDSTANNYDGNSVNDTSLITNSSGKINSAIKINGNAEGLNFSNNSIFNTIQSISLWVYINNITDTAFRTIIGRETDTNSTLLYQGLTKQLRLFHSNITGNAYINITGIPLGWNHIVATWNNTNTSLFLNGVWNTSGYSPQIYDWNTTQELRIGNNVLTTRGAKILIDEVGIWNRTLTQSEITDLYNGGSGMAYSGGFTINLISPASGVILLNQTVNFGCFVSADTTLTNVSLYIDGILNQTNISGVNNTFYNFTSILSLGNHNWTCEAINNIGEVKKETASLFSVNVFTTNLETYNNATTEGNMETFQINLTTATGYQISSANLVYNGTHYGGLLDNTYYPTYIIILRNLIVPDVASITNLSFHWNVTLTNGNTAISTSHNQSVAAFTLDNCTTNTVLLYNFTLKDEGTQDIMNGTLQNSSIEIYINIYSSDRSVSLIHMFTNYSKIYFAPICLSNNLTNEIYSLDGIIKYNAGGYATEYYNLQNVTLTNKTKNQTIFLYDLLSTDNQPFRIIYKDSSYLPVSDALINIQRKYISEGTFKTIEIPKTDSSGETVGNFVLNDIIYNFIVTKNGFTLGVFNNVRVVCQTPAISECKIDLNSFSSSIPITNYTLQNNFYSTLVFNKTTRITTATFSVLNGTVSVIKLNVSKEDSLGTIVCSESITTSSGTLTCTSSASIGNGTITAYLYKDGVLVGSKSFSLGGSGSDLFPGFATFLAIFIILTLMGAGISDNPVYTIIFFLLGIVLLFALNTVSGGIGVGATILWFIVAIVLVIIKLVKRR